MSARAILPPEPTAILPPNRPLPQPSGWERFVYRPPCSQYRNIPAGEVQFNRRSGQIRGNCSPNQPGIPWDFTCRWNRGRMSCTSSNGRHANSYNAICCPPPPGPRPPPFPDIQRCCQGNDFNSCAICLDGGYGAADSATHFANIQLCQANCRLF
jgi:hypothetical protein